MAVAFAVTSFVCCPLNFEMSLDNVDTYLALGLLCFMGNAAFINEVGHISSSLCLIHIDTRDKYNVIYQQGMHLCSHCFDFKIRFSFHSRF